MSKIETNDDPRPKIPWEFARSLFSGAIYGHVHTGMDIYAETGTELPEQAIPDTVARYLGLTVNLKHDVIPPVFIQPLLDFTHPDCFPLYDPIRPERSWYPLMRAEIENILYTPFMELYPEERPKIIPTDPVSRRVFQFLGFPDAETFIHGISHQISQVMEKNGIPHRQFDEAIAIASQVMKGKKRYSDEPFVCHIYRSIWYYLTAQEHLGVFQSPRHEFVGSDAATLAMHVILEEGQNVSLKEETQEGEGSKYYLTSLFGNIEVSHQQYVTLKALRAWDRQRKLKNAIELDPTGKAAELKLFDRLDNTLTLWYKTNWAQLVRKLYETYRSMGVLGWTARFSGNFIENTKMLLTLMDGKNWEAILATNLISFGMYNAALEEIKRIFITRMETTYGMDLTPPELDAWLEEFLGKHSGIPCSSLPELFNLKTNVVERYQEKLASEILFHDTLPSYPYPRPFGFTDLLPYMQLVWDTCSLDPYIPYFPGKAYAVYTHLPPEYIITHGAKLLLRQETINLRHVKELGTRQVLKAYPRKT